MKKAYIFTIGCGRRRLEGERYKEYFKKNDWKIEKNFKKVDLILFNSCGFNKPTEESCFKKIQKLINKKKSNCELIIGGCLPAINPSKLKGIFKGKSFTPQQIEKIDVFINAKTRIKQIKEHNTFMVNKTIIEKLFSGFHNLLNKRFISPRKCHREHSQPYFLRITNGCLGNCSYCAIKNATGKLRSKPIENIMQEFDKGLKVGYKYFYLIGEETGAYGIDIGINFIILLQKLLEKRGDYKLGIYDFNPQWLIFMFGELKELLKSPKIYSIQSDIQSGSDRILKLMKRNYKIQEVSTCFKELKEINPQLKIETEILIGFPSETEYDFNKTLDIIEKIKFNRIEAFKYHEKPTISSSKLSKKVSEDVKEKRIRKLKNFAKKNKIFIQFYG